MTELVPELLKVGLVVYLLIVAVRQQSKLMDAEETISDLRWKVEMLERQLTR